MDPSLPPLPRDHPLAGCDQKIRRAYEHFNLLHSEIKGLGSGEFHPATFRTEAKPDTDDTFWTFVESVEPPPLRLAPIVGDIVHNLRSSLDHLVYELAFLGLRGRRIPRKTAFPGSLTRANWNSSLVQGRLLEGVMQKHRAMLYRLQPCYRRHDQPSPAALRRRKRSASVLLHDLWNEDKHRIIQLMALAPYEIRPAIRFHNCIQRGTPTIHVGFLGGTLEEGTEVLTVPVKPTGEDPHVYVDIEISGQVCLLNGLPVRHALAHVGDWVAQVVESFQPVFETPIARRLWGLPRGSWVEGEPPLRKPRVWVGAWKAEAHPAAPPTG